MSNNVLFLALNDKIDKLGANLNDKVSTVETIKGDKGEKGDPGKKGDKGERGNDGLSAKDGKKGSDGKEGQKGEDGISVVSVDIDFDNQLSFILSDDSVIHAGKIEIEATKGSTYYSMSGASGVSQINGLEDYVRNIIGEDSLVAKRIDTADPYKYIGEADAGSLGTQNVWRIKRIEFLAGDDIEIRWADGSSEFTKIWDNRISLTYT